ncbi:MarR family winged helix-turn-helix transcriptional regulator [Thiohalobacter sp.]|uniref:MarR family winged helix-turn-helix transcriptional regulator n=1 Tax=Thiohalobacter sp. TaxID=2025948 RepID=UPI00260521C5|nr:MarR family transcriptional regulator [Thiohalobacter sp.]
MQTARPAPRPDDAADRVAVIERLRVVYRAMQAHSRWVERQCGVSAAQLWLLAALDRDGGMQVGALSRALSLHRSTTSNLLDKLERKGLVRRRRDGADQRVVRVELTPAGRDLVARAPGPTQGVIHDALGHLSAHELAALTAGLEALVAAMSCHAAEVPRQPGIATSDVPIPSPMGEIT